MVEEVRIEAVVEGLRERRRKQQHDGGQTDGCKTGADRVHAVTSLTSTQAPCR